jgi:hypothetical protein
VPTMTTAIFGKPYLKSKPVVLPLISLTTMLMITAGSFHIALADPIHCDQPGYPSCYSVGYNDGQANPGTNCPNDHSDNFCAGWQAGSLSGNTQPERTISTVGCGPGTDNSTCSNQETTPQGCGPGYDNSTCDNNPAPQSTLPEGCGYGTDNSTCSSQETGPNYSSICQTLQPVLIPQCNILVYSDGSLTPDGTHAMHCIRNGLLLGTGASLLGLPLPLVLKGLSILAPPTGCDGIVDMNGFNLLGNLGSLNSLLNLLP